MSLWRVVEKMWIASKKRLRMVQGREASRVSETFHETAGEPLVFALRLLGDHSDSFG